MEKKPNKPQGNRRDMEDTNQKKPTKKPGETGPGCGDDSNKRSQWDPRDRTNPKGRC